MAVRGIEEHVPPGRGHKEPEPLTESVTHVVEEARMLIPGITAFLGFQLIAVFNQGFSKLDRTEQITHLASMFLMFVSLVLILTPAAYHRQVERGWVSEGFVRLASRLIMGATPLFALAVMLDFYLLVRVVTEDRTAAAVAALVAFALTALLWYGLPLMRPLERLLRGDS